MVLNLKKLMACAVIGLMGMGVASCGSSSSGGSSGATTITGVVTAPSGALAKAEPRGFYKRFFAFFSPKESYAVSPSLSPVPGAKVVLFPVNSDGTVAGPAVATATADSNGKYSLILPAGTSLTGNLVVQAGNGTPVAVGTAGVINAPAVSTTLNLNPAAEAATESLITNLGNLKGFTNAQITAFVNLIQTFAQDPTLVGSSVSTTVSNIKTQLQTLINVGLNGVATASTSTLTVSSVAGTYNVLTYQAGMDPSGGFSRNMERGTVSLNSDGTFSGNLTAFRVGITESCPSPASSPCQRSFTQTPSTVSEIISGTYTLAGGGLVYFTPTNGNTVVGAINPTAQFIALPFTGGNFGIGVALRQATTAPTLGTYNWNQMQTDFNSPSFGTTTTGSWTTFSPSLSSGFVTMNGTTFTGNDSGGSSMMQTTSCTASGTSCSTLTAANASSAKPGQAISGTVSVTSTGQMTLTPAGNGSTLPGAASADGKFVVLQDGGPSASGGNMGIIVATNQPTSATTSTLNGTYNVISFEEDFNNNNTGIETNISTGMIVTNAGNFTVKGTNVGVYRTETCPGNTTSCPNISVSGHNKMFSATGTYTVTPNGLVTLTGSGNAFTFPGAVSADGSVFIFQNSQDCTGGACNSNSQRMIVIGVHQ